MGEKEITSTGTVKLIGGDYIVILVKKNIYEVFCD
jgi:hypothetical protein